ncbi:hypothetical protein MMC29_007427 [Sticta canariensis]|nr:hypothetical protein [Sticta canariensis]
MEVDNLLDFLKTPDIFDLDLIDNGMIAGTRIEVFYETGPMLNELMEIEKRIRHDYRRVARQDLRRLFRKYPILEFTERGQEPWNFYPELKRRMDVWKNARFCLRSSVSDKEKEATKAFSVFYHEHTIKNQFQFLNQQANAEFESGLLLNQYALDELWALTRRLKLRPLTPAQEEDRKKLERFVAAEVRDNLISMEWIEIADRVFNSGGSVKDHDFDKDRETAAKIVDERIAKGDWQGPGPYKSKFNGI